MSVAEIKENIRKLSPTEWREIASYLVTLRHGSMDNYRENLAQMIDDNTKENWVTLEEMDARLEK